MWLWIQKTGELLHNGVHVCFGYSGKDDGDGIPEPGEGKNDPTKQQERSTGPIPCGLWSIFPPYFSETKGPYVMRLMAHRDTVTFGRSGFLIHGDSKSNPGSASLGCIVLPPRIRQRIWESGDHTLLVLSGVDNTVSPS